MAQVIWSTKASRQIREIAEYIEKDSLLNARRVTRKIIATVRRLKTFPEIGAVASEYRNQGIRELLVYQYRIFYRFDEVTQQVHVVAITHGRQQIDPLLLMPASKTLRLNTCS